MRKLLVKLLVLTLLVSFVPTQPANAAKKPKLSKTKLNMVEGDTATLKMKNTKKKIKWSSSDSWVASVSKKGKVKAKNEGTATIKAKVGKKTYKCKVTVKAPRDPNEPYFTAYIDNLESRSKFLNVYIENYGDEEMVIGDNVFFGLYYPYGMSYHTTAYTTREPSYSGNTVTLAPGQGEYFFFYLEEYSDINEYSKLTVNFTYKGQKYFATIMKDPSEGSYVENNR